MSIVSAEPSVAAVEEKQRVCAETETRYREHVLKLQAKYAQDCDAADRAREPRPSQPAELVRQGPGFIAEQRDLARQHRAAVARVAPRLAHQIAGPYAEVVAKLMVALEPAWSLAGEAAGLVGEWTRRWRLLSGPIWPTPTLSVWRTTLACYVRLRGATGSASWKRSRRSSAACRYRSACPQGRATDHPSPLARKRLTSGVRTLVS